MRAALCLAALLAAGCSNAPAGVAESCADVDASACFSNGDCAAASRCSVPTSADPNVAFACCLAGARGAGTPGAPCGTPDDCTSGVCAYAPSGSACSVACQPASPSCPGALPACVALDAGPDGSIVHFCGLSP